MRFAFSVLAACLVSFWLVRCAMGEETEPVSVRAVAFSPDGSRLVVGFGTREVAGGLLIWNVKEKRAEHKREYKTGIYSLSFSSDGKLLALSAYDRAPQVLQWPSLQLEAELPATRRGPVAFARDGNLLATGSEDGSVVCWDVAARQDQYFMKGHRESPYTITFSPDAERIAAAGRDGVLVWKVATGEEERRLKHGNSLTSSVLFSPDGRWILTGGWEGTTRLWDAESGALRVKFSGIGGVDRIAFAPEINTLAAIGTGNAVALYPLTFAAPAPEVSAKMQDVLQRFQDDSYAVREAASAEVVKLGFAGENELSRAMKESPSAEVRIRARRARQAILSQPLVRLNEHTARTRCLSFSTAGDLLATGADDGTTRLWDVAGRKQVAFFSPAEVARSLEE